MQTKAEALAKLKDEFEQWNALSAQVAAGPDFPVDQVTLKRTLIHLWAWQQHSVAYLEAALHNRKPATPPWPYVITGDDEGDVDETNAWIAQNYYSKTWDQAYQDWRSGFERFIALTERLPELDLLDGAKYPWREGWPLMASLEGSYEHHREHREGLLNNAA